MKEMNQKGYIGDLSLGHGGDADDFEKGERERQKKLRGSLLDNEIVIF